MTMDLKKLLLYFALFMVSMTLWQKWVGETKPTPAAQPAATRAAPVSTEASAPSEASSALPTQPVARRLDRLVSLTSNTLHLEVSQQGGSIVRAELLKYPQALRSDKPFTLLSPQDNQLYIAESGVNGFGHNQQPLDFEVKAKQTFNRDNLAGQRLILQAQVSPGVLLEKTIEIIDNSHLITVTQRLSNQTAQTLSGQIYSQLVRQPVATKHGFFGVSSYNGAAVSLPPDKLYEKVSFDTIKKDNLYKSVDAGWVAMQQPYFISAWIPQSDQHSLIYSRYQSHTDGDDLYTIGSKTKTLSVAPRGELTVTNRLYTGPVITEKLKQIAPGLELTIDYGIFWLISTPIFYVLKQIHDLVGNWGWAIVLITLLIKLLFFQLSAKSYYSMARLRQLQPKVDALRERYKDNKEKMTKAMMELYSKEKVSPFGGCLPIVIQIPVFIALYWVLIESVELRQAPWILWIQDLSAKDPYYILPIIMGATMLVQQMLSPPPADPTQKQVMMAMPIVFTFLFATFPAGLVLYWTVNNTVSILQQWIITQRVEHQVK